MLQETENKAKWDEDFDNLDTVADWQANKTANLPLQKNDFKKLTTLSTFIVFFNFGGKKCRQTLIYEMNMQIYVYCEE